MANGPNNMRSRLVGLNSVDPTLTASLSSGGNLKRTITPSASKQPPTFRRQNSKISAAALAAHSGDDDDMQRASANVPTKSPRRRLNTVTSPGAAGADATGSPPAAADAAADGADEAGSIASSGSKGSNASSNASRSSMQLQQKLRSFARARAAQGLGPTLRRLHRTLVIALVRSWRL